jgi:ribose transport system permease protein
MGAPFFVEPIFNGAMLILAVGLAVTASKRRTKLGAQAQGLPVAASSAPANE